MEHATSHSYPPPHDRHHAHLHGVADPKIVSTDRGLRALKWSFGALAAGAALQLAVAIFSGSIALFADTIHNAADAATAIPLAIAFLMMRRAPSSRFTYGYGRVEDLAGVAIIAVILMSAIVAGYEAVERLITPRAVSNLGMVAVAAVIGFAANETAALIRTRTGRAINSAALIADGHHARIDGLASLAVAAGAAAVRLGYPTADPIIALAIAILILGIVWESGREVFTRLLDGVDPRLLSEVHHACEHVPGILKVFHTRARWIGHRLHAEADIAVDPELSVREGAQLANRFTDELKRHLPENSILHVAIRASEGRPS